MTSEVDEGGQRVKQYENDDLVFDHDEYARAQKSKFRFKSSKRKSDHDSDGLDTPIHRDEHPDDHRHRHRHRRHHHRSKRKRSAPPPDDPSLYDDTYLPNGSSSQYLDPDVAFRESLFDAMADDEGAAFWEGVYGQPIPAIPIVKEGPTGELERMSEEEYASYVRAEMYKKTHAYALEEKARREKAKKEQEDIRKESRREAEEAERFRKQVDESLRRGRERKERVQRAGKWAERWKEYEKAWVELVDQNKTGAARIPWPVLDGKRDAIGKEEIESFFLNAPTAGKPDQSELLKTLKTERVRWHPDKMQQKLGGQAADEANMRSVTAVFQIIDQMWTEMRHRNDHVLGTSK